MRERERVGGKNVRTDVARDREKDHRRERKLRERERERESEVVIKAIETVLKHLA